MFDLHELYSELIREHSRKPRAMRELPHANRIATGFNPLCGDRIVMQLRVNPPQGDGNIDIDCDVDPVDQSPIIEDAAFTGAACAICTSSASMLCESVRGQSEAEAERKAAAFIDALTHQADIDADALQRMGDAAALLGVKRFPMRVKCATLPWHTMRGALTGEAAADGTVSTE